MAARGLRLAVAALLAICSVGVTCSEAAQEASGAQSTASNAQWSASGARQPDSVRWLQLLADYLGGASVRGERREQNSLPTFGGGGALPVLVLPLLVPTRDRELTSNKDSEYELEYERRPSRPTRPLPPSRDSYREEGERVGPVRPTQRFGEAFGDKDFNKPTPSRPKPGDPPSNTIEDDPQVPLPAIDEAQTQYLVELFREQQPRDPSLPPMLLSHSPPRYDETDAETERHGDAGKRAARQVRFGSGARAGGARVGGAVSDGGLARVGGEVREGGGVSVGGGVREGGGLSVGGAVREGTGVHQAAEARGTPPPLRLDESLMVRGELTVHRADYSEPYVAWYDAASGSSRVELHGGTGALYRSFGADNTVQRVQMVVDRTGDSGEVRRCVAMNASASRADAAPPLFPDFSLFSFNGTERRGGAALERWTREARGLPGELGAAPGEALAFRHRLLAARDQAGRLLPREYSVEVDSSVLGPRCDQYRHRYHEVRRLQPDEEARLRIDLDRECDTLERTDRLDMVDPLREFTMPHRDTRYDTQFADYIKKFTRKYADGAEAAMRKNLLMQTVRFVESANRQGGPARLGLNFLSDRLDAELEPLLGVRFSDHRQADAAPFPYSRGEARALDDRLPRRFDWRARGAVTHVRYQDQCPACWAFSVVAAVEGALFVQTGRLVPLSDKCLLDCGHRPGDTKCRPTWLDSPYAHIQSHGIVALQDYPPYRPVVEECRERRSEPVTFISGYVNVTSFSVPALKVAIRRHGPNAVLVDGKCKSFQHYASGVLEDYRCLQQLKKLNHAVAAVGWGERRGQTHWVVKNSWSASWGERGFARLHAASNTCGALTQPSYPELRPADVHRLPPAAAAAAADAPDHTAGTARL